MSTGRQRRSRWADRKLRCVLAVSAAAVLMAAGLPGSSTAAVSDPGKPKSETVYAVLENDGRYNGATVVNCFDQSGDIVDYGAYTSVVNMTGPGTAVVEGDKIIWPASATDGVRPFYYQGETQKPLPVSIAITYYLDGRQTEPEQIAGSTGELEIAFHIVNNTGTGEMDAAVDREVMTPFAVQVSLALPNTMYAIADKPENATVLMAGSACTLSYACFPMPEDTFSILLKGFDMELEPISIILVPKAPPGLDAYGDFVDVDGILEGADDMIDGADEMQTGVGSLRDALIDMKDAAKKLTAALDGLANGTKDLHTGAAELSRQARTLRTAAADFRNGVTAFTQGLISLDNGLAALETGAAQMAAVLSDLNTGAGAVSGGVTALDSGLQGLAASNGELAALADAVAAANPGDANAVALAAGLARQQTVINSITAQSAGLKTLAGDVSLGLQAFYSELSGDFAGNVAALRAGSAELNVKAGQLSAGASDLSAACAAMSAAVARLSGGAEALWDGSRKAARRAPALVDAIGELIDGVGELDDGLMTLNEDGLKTLRNKFDGLDGYLQKLSAKADEYGSFMDTRNAPASTVQFVLKTKGILRDISQNDS